MCVPWVHKEDIENVLLHAFFDQDKDEQRIVGARVIPLTRDQDHRLLWVELADKGAADNALCMAQDALRNKHIFPRQYEANFD